MKKFIIIALFLLVGVVGLGYYLKQTVGDVRPALLPFQKTMSSLLKKPTPLPNDTQLTVFGDNSITTFSENVDGVRDLQFSPGGTLLVTQMNKGIVAALPDRNNNSKADEVKKILSGLSRPHGMAFYNGKLFVAEETRLVRYNWDESTLTATVDKKILDLPRGGRHFTRSLVFDPSTGSGKVGKLYISLGSTCDVCFEKNSWIASVIITDENGSTPRVFASGLRNVVFIKFNPQTQELWGTEMGRDFLGDTLPPDEINILKDGGNYGWPICFGDGVYDTKFNGDGAHCASTVHPVYKLPAHVAPLGLTFWRGDLIVGLHGSWNSSTPVGYRVVRMKTDGRTVSEMEDLVTGFLKGNNAIGRPVDVEVGSDDALYISDDKAGAVYRVM